MNVTAPSHFDPTPALNIEAEQALLGAILINNQAFDRVSIFLKPKHFGEPLHGRIYEAIETLITSGRSANPVTLKPFIDPEQKVADLTLHQYLVRMATEAVTIINAYDFAMAIHDSWVRREIIAVGESMAHIARHGAEVRDILREIEPYEDVLSDLRVNRADIAVKEGAGQSYLAEISATRQRGEIRGVPIAFPEISRVLSDPCFEARNLYGLLSSSGEGKTSLALQLMYHAFSSGHPVVFLSFDQSRTQCIRQLISQIHGIEARRQRAADLSEKEWDKAGAFSLWVDKQPFEIIECSEANAPQLVRRASTTLKKIRGDKVPLVVIDHIGAIRPDELDRRSDPGTRAKGILQVFKDAAKRDDCAYLIINQRNTYGMDRDNPRPISKDLFGGDGTKQPYDAILYLYRYKKFYEDRKAVASSDSDWKKIEKVFPSAVRVDDEDIAEIGAIKVRFGNPNIRERLIFEAEYTRYRPEKKLPDADQTAIKGL